MFDFFERHPVTFYSVILLLDILVLSLGILAGFALVKAVL